MHAAMVPNVTQHGGAVRYTAVAGLARMFAKAASASGLDVDRVARDIGLHLEPDELEQRVPAAQLMEFVARLSLESGNELLGLDVASVFAEAASFGALGYSLRTSATLGHAIDRLVRHARLMNEGTQVWVERTGTTATIFDGPKPPLWWPRAYAEMAMAAFFALARKWTDASFRPVDVAFTHPQPPAHREIAAAFGCPVRYREPINSITFPLEVLALPFTQGDERLAVFLDRRLEPLTRALAEQPGELARVREEVRKELTGELSLQKTARSLAMSVRTLQRRLAEQGTTFEALVDDVRKELALEALRRPRVSIQEVSFLCGYADARAFRRAFRRWTGSRPVDYARSITV